MPLPPAPLLPPPAPAPFAFPTVPPPPTLREGAHVIDADEALPDVPPALAPPAPVAPPSVPNLPREERGVPPVAPPREVTGSPARRPMFDTEPHPASRASRPPDPVPALPPEESKPLTVPIKWNVEFEEPEAYSPVRIDGAASRPLPSLPVSFAGGPGGADACSERARVGACARADAIRAAAAVIRRRAHGTRRRPGVRRAVGSRAKGGRESREEGAGATGEAREEAQGGPPAPAPPPAATPAPGARSGARPDDGAHARRTVGGFVEARRRAQLWKEEAGRVTRAWHNGRRGELTERPKVTVLKTVEASCVSVGSNPTLSATARLGDPSLRRAFAVAGHVEDVGERPHARDVEAVEHAARPRAPWPAKPASSSRFR